MITKYGYSTVGFITSLIVLIFVVVLIFIENQLIIYSVLIISGGFFLFTLYFFRDPERIPPAEESILVSPADGKVLLIKDVITDRYLTGSCKQVSIFMSPLNVHVNRIPISGKVEYLDYIEGEFLAAFHEKADQRNERTEIGINTDSGKILFTQVAGTIARRIVCRLNVNDDVLIGERFGMIKFGSRVDIILPDNHEILVKVGQKVSAGTTIISRIN